MKKQAKKIEVEVRIILKDRQAIEGKLLSLGAKAIYASHLIDRWFCPKSARNHREAIIDKTGFALRIRESQDSYSGVKNSSLECKKLVDGKDHSICHEHEMPLSDVATTRAILDDIGLKEFLVIDKERIIYKYKNAKFCFDRVRNLGDALEIEVMASGDLLKAKEKMIGLALELGVKRSEVLEKGITYLAMQKLAKY